MRAALKLFAVKDFSRITLRDIQRASGFDAALIYYYFKDKQDLFDAAVCFALTEPSGADDRSNVADGNPVEVIRSWLRHCLQRAEYNRTIFRIMLHYAGSKRSIRALDESVKNFYQREEMEILAASVRCGVESKLFRPVDPLAIARYVSVHLDGITAASMVRRKFDVEAAFRDLEAALWLQLNYTPVTVRMRSTRVSIGR